MTCSRFSLIMSDADCIQTSYKVPAFVKEIPSAVADIHGTTELEIELAWRLCRTECSTAGCINNKQLQKPDGHATVEGSQEEHASAPVEALTMNVTLFAQSVREYEEKFVGKQWTQNFFLKRESLPGPSPEPQAPPSLTASLLQRLSLAYAHTGLRVGE